MSGARLVVADDDAVLREALCDLLEDGGFVIVGQARTGQEAVDLARDLRPDLLLMDLRMPELTGLEAATLLRAEAPTLPVVILSAYEDVGLQIAAEQIPVAAYLVKGCTARELFGALHAALEPARG